MKEWSVLFYILLVPFYSTGQKTILWEVKDTVNLKTSTIIGTFHQFGNSFVDSIPQINEKLKASELAIFESISKSEQTQKLINNRARSIEIEKFLSKKDLLKLKELSRDWQVDIYKLKPIEIKWKLQQEFQKKRCGTTKPSDKWTHFDNYLQSLAKENGIQVFGLETDSAQLDFISEEHKFSNWKKERKFISFWINQMHTKKPNLNSCILANKYRVFDIEYNFEQNCPDDILVKKRNENWLNVLPGIMQNKDCFVAVGYFHLKNKCGLLEKLKERGFLVKPIKIK